LKDRHPNWTIATLCPEFSSKNRAVASRCIDIQTIPSGNRKSYSLCLAIGQSSTFLDPQAWFARSAADMSDLDDGGEPLDLTHLDAQTGGDLSLQRDLPDLFIVQSANLVAQMRALDQADPAVSDLAHRLNGSARAIGAFKVAGAAAAVEKACGAGRRATAALDDLVAALGKALIAIEAHIRSLSSRHGARSSHPLHGRNPFGRRTRAAELLLRRRDHDLIIIAFIPLKKHGVYKAKIVR
jgi:HPt (histidine-containing phosphotransfer) domain-containing protein